MSELAVRAPAAALEERDDAALLSLLYRREKALLLGGPARLERARLLSARLARALRERRGRPRASFDPERLILLVTTACQLRCTYCGIDKDSGESMSEATARRGVELLMASRRPSVQLQFFGGDPLLRFDLIGSAVARAEALKKRPGAPAQVRYMLTTNGHALDARKLSFFKPLDFLIEFSFDGRYETFQAQRPGLGGRDFYAKIRRNLDALRRSGVRYYVIAVATPESVAGLSENVDYIASLGHRRIQVNYQLGRFWSRDAVRTLLSQMGRVARSAARGRFELINATVVRREPTVLNSELVIDVDGGIYRETGMFMEKDFQEHKRNFLVADVGAARLLESYAASPFDNFLLFSRLWARSGNALFRKIVLNNIEVGLAVDRWTRGLARGAAS